MAHENPFAQTEEAKSKYPEALSRRAFSEGGYTFLKRVLQQAIETGKPVVINTGKNYLEYTYTEGQESFMDGIKVLEGEDSRALEAFKGVADSYVVSQGVQEIKEEK